MAFCFKRKETVSKAIRRLGCERIEHALECLKDCGRAETIHCARKDIKKLRTVLRLVRRGIPKKQFCRLKKLLREAANHLAPLRDAYIKAKTLRDLARHFKGQIVPGALRHIRPELQNSFEKEMKRFEKEKTARAAERTLRRMAKELERLNVSGKGWKALSPGVKKAYSRGQCAYQTVLKNSSPRNFHEWRKSVKDLWYQVILLHPVWPEQMDAMANELEALGEHLGDDHDLFALRQTVEELGTDDSSTLELHTLNGSIEERQRALRSAALSLGARFYAEKLSTFCNRLAGYWQTWRRAEKSTPWSAASPTSPN